MKQNNQEARDLATHLSVVNIIDTYIKKLNWGILTVAVASHAFCDASVDQLYDLRKLIREQQINQNIQEELAAMRRGSVVLPTGGLITFSLSDNALRPLQSLPVLFTSAVISKHMYLLNNQDAEVKIANSLLQTIDLQIQNRLLELKNNDSERPAKKQKI